MVDPNTTEANESRTVRIYGTGHPIYGADRAGLEYVGTAIDPDAPLVWHVFIKEAS